MLALTPNTWPGRPARQARRYLGCARDAASGHRLLVMATDHSRTSEHEPHLEVPIAELLDRARPLLAHQEMMIDDLAAEEGKAFLSAIRS